MRKDVETAFPDGFDNDLGDLRDGLWVLGQAQRLRPEALRVLSSGDTPPQLEAAIADGRVQRWRPKPLGHDALVDLCALAAEHAESG